MVRDMLGAEDNHQHIAQATTLWFYIRYWDNMFGKSLLLLTKVNFEPSQRPNILQRSCLLESVCVDPQVVISVQRLLCRVTNLYLPSCQLVSGS
jgi:hypothetical protein